MAVTYQTEGVKMPDIKKRETTEWIKAVAASYGKRLGEIAYIFCSDEKILEVNRQYLQHDYYTDIITFDYCEGDRLSGDLFISLDTIHTNAEQFGTPIRLIRDVCNCPPVCRSITNGTSGLLLAGRNMMNYPIRKTC